MSKRSIVPRTPQDFHFLQNLRFALIYRSIAIARSFTRPLRQITSHPNHKSPRNPLRDPKTTVSHDMIRVDGIPTIHDGKPGKFLSFPLRMVDTVLVARSWSANGTVPSTVVMREYKHQYKRAVYTHDLRWLGACPSCGDICIFASSFESAAGTVLLAYCPRGSRCRVET